MHGRKRRGAMALGTLVAVPLAAAEAAEARPTADDGGGGTTSTPSTPPAADPGPAKRPPPKPANPTIDTGARATPPVANDLAKPTPKRQYADDRRQPAPVVERPEPEPANPTIDTGARATPPVANDLAKPTPKRRYADDRRQPRPAVERPEPKPANPTIDVETPPIGRQTRPPELPRTPDAAEAWLRGGAVPAQAEEEEPEAEKEVETAPKGSNDGGFSFGVDVDLPGEDFDFSPRVHVSRDPADNIGPRVADTVSPLGGLLKLQDRVREQLPERVRPFAVSPAESLAIGGNWLADQIPAGPEEPTLEDGPRALVEGYMRNNLRDGIRTLTGLPQGIVQMPKDIHTDISNATEDLYRSATGAEPREGSEKVPGETGLEHYTRNHPFTGGFANLGVNMWDRYYPFVAARYGNYEPLREDMTDPETGKMRAPTLVRDYYRAPNSTLLEDLTIPSLFVPFAKVPVRVKPPATVRPPTTVKPPPKTPVERYRDRSPKLAPDEGTTRVLEEQFGHSSSGTRANTKWPEHVDPQTGETVPRMYNPNRHAGGTSELWAYNAMNHVDDVVQIRLVEHSGAGKTADAVLTMRRPDGTLYTTRFEQTSVTIGRGSAPRPVGVGRAPQATPARLKDAIRRKTRDHNQFQDHMDGVGTGGIQGIHVRGEPLSATQLEAVVHSTTTNLRNAGVTEVWFFRSDRSIVRVDVDSGTHTVVEPPKR